MPNENVTTVGEPEWWYVGYCAAERGADRNLASAIPVWGRDKWLRGYDDQKSEDQELN